MPYDLFISYSRRDNADDRITQLVERIKADFAPFAKRELVPFFDQQEIAGMQDWRQRILQGLHESRLLLACLSPAYLIHLYLAHLFFCEKPYPWESAQDDLAAEKLINDCGYTAATKNLVTPNSLF